MKCDGGKLKTFVAGLLLAVATDLGGVATRADAPPAAATGVTRVEIERSDVPGTDLETRLYLITYSPGAAAPLHHHPVDGLGYILEGCARSAYGNDAPVTLVAGQSFHDLAIVPHTLFANADPYKTLRFLVAYTVKRGAPVMEAP